MSRFRGLGNRVEKALDSVRSGRQYGSDSSGAWPKGKQIDLDDAGLDSATRVRSEIACADEFDGMRVYAGSDCNDTIPSPPPELESAPWHDER